MRAPDMHAPDKLSRGFVQQAPEVLRKPQSDNTTQNVVQDKTLVSK